MLHIALMLGMLAWFWYTAKDHGRTVILWIIVGAGSYLVPVVLFDVFVSPVLEQQYYEGFLAGDHDTWVALLIGGFSLLCGVVCCLIARRILLSYEAVDIE
jgi:hypothetical protein